MSVKKSHTGRNLSILALLVAVVVIAIALSGPLLAPQAPTFTVFIHVYDPALASSPEAVTDQNQLVANVIVTVSGPRNFTAPTPNGILVPNDPLPSGSYSIIASKTGYETTTIHYTVGPSCDRRDSQGNCHAWIAMPRALVS